MLEYSLSIIWAKEEEVTKLTTVRMAVYASWIIIAHMLSQSVPQGRERKVGRKKAVDWEAPRKEHILNRWAM